MNSIHEFRKIPFVRLIIPLILGLITGFYFKISLCLIVTIACLLVIYFITILFINNLSGRYEFRLAFGICVNIFIIVSGILLIKSKSDYQENISAAINSSEYYLCKLINQPEQKSGTIKVLLRIIGYKDSDSWYKCKTNIIAYFQKDNNAKTLSSGKIIILKSRLRKIYNSKNPCEFDYKKLLKHKGIRYQSYIKTGTWQTVGQRDDLITFAIKLRNKLLNLYKKYGINDSEFAVLSAFTLGYKDELNPEIRHAFISAGAMHFLAVSGLHVGIIFYVLNNLFKFCGRTKYGKNIKLILIVIILWFYALLTGLSSSVIRASAMFTLIQAGISLNRTINIYNIVAFAAFSILLCHPLEIYDTGFQLSFLAVLSIIFFQPFFYKLLIFKNRILDKIWMLFTVSVSAQLGVFPIIIYYFHHFSVYFWLSNILIVFPLALSIYLAILLFIFYPVNQIALIIAAILDFILRIINFLIMTIEKLPGSMIENIYNNSSETLLLYILIISISTFIILKNRNYLSVSLICLICFLSVNFLRTCKIYKQKKIIVFNINKYTAINFINSRNNYLLTDLNPEKDRRILLNAVQNSWLKYGVNDRSKVIDIGSSEGNKMIFDNTAELHIKQLFNNMFVGFRDKKLLILYNSDLFKYTSNKKYRLDYLIIGNNLQCHIKTMTNLFDIDKIVIDSSNDFRTRQFWEKECKEYGINCNIISVEGALEIEL
jgi:competence protein ComEC